MIRRASSAAIAGSLVAIVGVILAFRAGRRAGQRRHVHAMVGCMVFPRITTDPAVCTGKPCIRGLRFPVARLLGLLAAGETRETILASYPYLEPEDIEAALLYAAFLAEDETLELVR